MQRADLGRAEVDARAERLEHVGRAGAARRRAVAVLGDGAARAGGDQRRGRRDVERAAARRRCRRCRAGRRGRSARARRARASCAPARRARRPSRPSCAARSGSRRSAISETLAVHDLGEHLGGLRRRDRSRREASASIALVSDRVGHQLALRGSSPSSSRPCSVSTDSGWNWTPSAGSSRWRSAHQHAAAAGGLLQAVGQLVVDDQRVVAPDRQRAGAGRRRSCARRARSSSPCRGSGRGSSTSPAERLRERLVAEADAERRHARLGEAPHDLERDAGLVRRARARARRRSGRSRPRAARRRSARSLRTASTSAPSSPRYWTRL